MGNDCCAARNDKPVEKEKLYVRLSKPAEVEKIKAHIAKEFKAADKNNNGSLNFEELYAVTCKAHEQAGLEQPKKESVRATLYANDKDKDKSLKLDEYTEMVMKHLHHVADLEKKADEEAAAKKADEDKKKKADEEAKKKADDEAHKKKHDH
eukprot:CAMPEP_0176432570 /NCGR_PEP_ID=MMETSP0127-20121128/15472_1 /TAXON_ID=938130 /ORGANISM="Platyophrya macrostoma, Strain WH" /LENGTH=151 /DNA_ID=CAMNT_0017814765 /DNA_START=32 /DNA_END=487 /DNA_ORIENTATION=-